ncbi:MAG: deoxyribonuclease V [Candidatus Bathyarchaeota archaeon]|nr:deoxyribonuclease V [Candidatus Bathyarchaeota archaeon]
MEERGKLANPKRFKRELPVQFNSKFSVAKAHAMQRSLAKQVVREDDLPRKIRFVAGADVAYVGEISIGVATVLNYDSLALIESQVAQVKTRFPYIPTLLSFREIPPTLAAITKLKNQPDVFLVNGHGIAHPYRLGFASHLGLVIAKSTIGVAKSVLCGKAEKMTDERCVYLADKGDVVGAVVETKVGRKPLYVSIGHKVSLERAIEIVRRCTRIHRVPEPIWAAHKIANDEKRKHLESR